MEGWGFETTGILRDILNRMEKDFSRLSLTSDILEPLNELTREMAKDNEEYKYTSLPTFAVSAKAELLDDTDDSWNLSRLKRRKLVSERLRKFERTASKPFEVVSGGYTTKNTRNKDRHPDDDNEFRKMRGCLHTRRLYRIKNFCEKQIPDMEHDNNNEDDDYSLPHISAFHQTGNLPGAGSSRSIPLQEYQSSSPLRPQSVPVDCFRNKSLFYPTSNLREHQLPEASQKSYEFHKKSEELERPKVPDSLLAVGPEINIRDMVNFSNSSLDQTVPSINKTNDNVENAVITENAEAYSMNVRNLENNSISQSEQLHNLLADLCPDAQRISIPPEICPKDDLQHRMDEEFRSESLPDIVRCDNRTMNGRVPRFSFRSDNSLSWTERRQQIEAALSWLRSELELLRAQDKTLLSQLQHCQETIDVIKNQKSVAAYDSEEDEGHWEDWELAEYERNWENNPEMSDSTGEDNSTGTVISVYELKPITQPATDIECSF